MAHALHTRAASVGTRRGEHDLRARLGRVPGLCKTFLGASCGALPQTSAIFLLTMIYTFRDNLTGVHYAGSRAQLRGDEFKRFIASYAEWNVPDNPWRFLFGDARAFDLSIAVKAAQAAPDGDTMLGGLFTGGLCFVAKQFWSADTSAADMCQRLLDRQLVFYQSCRATRTAQALNVGTTAGGLVGATIGMSAAASGFAGAMASAPACFALSLIPFVGPFLASACVIEEVAEIVGVVAATAVATGIGYGVARAVQKCPFSQYYMLERQGDGSYKKVPWQGNPGELPPRG